MTEVHATPMVVAEQATPAPILSILQSAVDKGANVEALEKLVSLYERLEDRRAVNEFADALARFQMKCPPIKKTAEAKAGPPRSGGGSSFGGYLYAPLEEVARTVNPLLAAEGLSYSWNTWFSEDGKRLRVTCVLRHRSGHSITSDFDAPTETVTQAMSPQQRVANAQSYGRRYSLIAVLGLSTCDPDDDGAEIDTSTLTPEQVEIVEALIQKRPDGARARVLTFFGVATMEEIPGSRFEWLKADLEQKISREARP